jgi:hypothetical protein
MNSLVELLCDVDDFCKTFFHVGKTSSWRGNVDIPGE